MCDMPKQLIQKKIKKLVDLQAAMVKQLVGIDIDRVREYQRIYSEWQANLVTAQEIQDDIDRHLSG